MLQLQLVVTPRQPGVSLLCPIHPTGTPELQPSASPSTPSLSHLSGSTRDFLSSLLRKENVWLINAACLTTLSTIYKLQLPLINSFVPESKTWFVARSKSATKFSLRQMELKESVGPTVTASSTKTGSSAHESSPPPPQSCASFWYNGITTGMMLTPETGHHISE